MLYHAFPPSRAKQVFQVLDHSAIFLLIAGTYTPFTLGVLRGAWGWSLLGLVWSLALTGVVLKAISGIRYPRLSMGLYLGIGWVALIAVKPLWLLMPAKGLFWGSSQEASHTRREPDSTQPSAFGTVTSSGTCSPSQARRVISSQCYATQSRPSFDSSVGCEYGPKPL